MHKSTTCEGFFTKHSLRKTGTIRLFRQAADQKIVNEFTGHSRDAVDAYQITSDEEKKEISKIIAREYIKKSSVNKIQQPNLLELCIS